MPTLRHPFAAVLLFALLLSAPAQDDKLERAPRFNAKTLSGEKFDNTSIKGKVVLLQFWTTWCQYCRSQQELVDRIESEFAGQGLIVLAVNVAESKKKVQKFLAENPRKCRIVLTDDTNLAAMYAANRYPIYVVIDRDGNIADQQNGAGGERALRSLLASAGLRQKAVGGQ
jgi:thiol-disulfide isomerase/thioredoxin